LLGGKLAEKNCFVNTARLSRKNFHREKTRHPAIVPSARPPPNCCKNRLSRHENISTASTENKKSRIRFGSGS